MKETVPEKVPHIHLFAKFDEIRDISLDVDNSSLVNHGEWIPNEAEFGSGFAYKNGNYIHFIEIHME